MKNFIIYSDGACSGNPGPGGWATVLYNPVNKKVIELGDRDPATTNNRMEITGCLEGLKLVLSTVLAAAKKKESMIEQATKVQIFTDSTYLINGATRWKQGWKSRGWKNAKGEAIQNPDLWIEVDRVITALREQPHLTLNWHYVPGHEGIDGNERCDEIAVAFSKGDQPYLFEGDVKEYSFDILTLPPEFPMPEMKFEGFGTKSKEEVFYLSSVGGIVYRHKTWASCEARVKGVAQAKYKKLKTDAEIPPLFASWGVPVGTPIKES